jgi:hypothetical protein
LEDKLCLSSFLRFNGETWHLTGFFKSLFLNPEVCANRVLKQAQVSTNAGLLAESGV